MPCCLMSYHPRLSGTVLVLTNIYSIYASSGTLTDQLTVLIIELSSKHADVCSSALNNRLLYLHFVLWRGRPSVDLV